jgi:hypothetical protein
MRSEKDLEIDGMSLWCLNRLQYLSFEVLKLNRRAEPVQWQQGTGLKAMNSVLALPATLPLPNINNVKG